MRWYIEFTRSARECCFSGICESCKIQLDQVTQELTDLFAIDSTLVVEGWNWSCWNYESQLLAHVDVTGDFMTELYRIGEASNLKTYVHWLDHYHIRKLRERV